MPRPITLAGAQLGPIHKADSRESVVKRLCDLLQRAHAKGAQVCVFPELALTTFFPRWYMEGQQEVDTWFEEEMPNAATKPLFDLAASLKIGLLPGLCGEVRRGWRGASLQHRHLGRPRTARLLASTARCTCRAIRNLCRAIPGSTWKSAIRGGQPGLPCVADHGRRDGHVHLQ